MPHNKDLILLIIPLILLVLILLLVAVITVFVLRVGNREMSLFIKLDHPIFPFTNCLLQASYAFR